MDGTIMPEILSNTPKFSPGHAWRDNYGTPLKDTSIISNQKHHENTVAATSYAEISMCRRYG